MIKIMISTHSQYHIHIQLCVDVSWCQYATPHSSYHFTVSDNVSMRSAREHVSGKRWSYVENIP